jgi:hypothetical protein
MRSISALRAVPFGRTVLIEDSIVCANLGSITVGLLVALARRAVEAGSALCADTDDVANLDMLDFLADSYSLSYDL